MPTKNFRHVRKTSVIKTPDGGRIKLGSYRPDKKNPNDKVFKSSQFSAANLPPKVDLRPYMSPIENQGDSNSCTANAMAGAYEYLAKRVKGSAHDVSRLFIYYNARDLDGASDSDEGTYLRSCIKVLKKYGTCAETTWPFDLHRIFEPPHDRAYDEAVNFLIEDAYRVDVDLDAMRSCLAEGYPFTFGLTLFASFQKAGSKGLVPMPDPENEQHDGGHAMLCVGYSDADKVFIVRNSWGEGWGDRGYCYIPYDYMTNADLNGDLWTIHHVTDADIDLSQDIQGSNESLFDGATAAIANAIQVSGGGFYEDDAESAVEYETQSVFVDGQYVSIVNSDVLEALYYADYDDEYEEYTLIEEFSSTEVSEESEFSETTFEESEETEASYEEDSEEEETEASYEEDSEEEFDSEEDESEETEDSYEEDSEEDEEDSEEESDETEDSYEEDSEEDESEEDESETIEDSYEEDESESEEEYGSEEESDVEEEYDDTEASYEDSGEEAGEEE